jgi:TIR domain/Pentapeptide repeats (8 copies)
MANDEHVALLRKGVDAWNEWWRQEAPGLKADLSGANLIRADLSGANLIQANLIRADLSGANLIRANLRGANLLWADLRAANLRGANLLWADLRAAHLGEANLIAADLRGANLRGANLVWANLNGADLTEAVLHHTVFGDTTLSHEVKGLDQCRHAGPSIVDFQTLKNSGPLPIAFLRGAGLPDNLIEYLPKLNEAIQFYSCFISYSHKDELFAERLHADLQNKGVRCWFAPHDMPIGAKIIDALDEAIRLRDKVLLILSEGAIASDWVEGEVTRALDEERTRKQVVLFPVRIDDAVMQTLEAWARLLRGQRNIGDFSRWKEHDSYQKSFERLMRDLRVESEGGR